MSLIILTDDLTGAADCGARCHQAGIAATIVLPGSRGLANSGALCYTSDSRHLPADLAAVRGHLGQELDALLDTLGRSCALVCPAFPAQRRGLVDGYLAIQPAPAQPPHLPTLLALQSRRRVTAVRLNDVRGGAEWLAERLLAERARGAELLVVDALDDADLQTVLDAMLRALPDALLCGSAGLAGMLAAYVGRHTPFWNDAQSALVAGPALLVIGSGSPMAQRQIEYLRRHQLVATFEQGADLPPGIAIDLLMHLPAPPPGAVLDGPAARRLAEQLAAAALPLIDAVRPGLLVLS